MVEPLFEETYEYVSEDGDTSDECLAGRTAFRPKRAGAETRFWMTPIKEPNQATLDAMNELENGGGQRFDDVATLFEDLGI